MRHATDVSPAEPEAEEPAWVPGSDGDTLGSRNAGPAPQEGSEAVDDQGPDQARGSLTVSERLGRRRRLTEAAQFRRVGQGGRRRRTAFFEITWFQNDAGHPRLGLIVPKFQSTAVARNRLRRRLKEIVRRLGLGSSGVDVVLRARPEAYRARVGELKSELEGWAESVRCGR